MAGLVYIAVTALLMLGTVFDQVGLSLVLVGAVLVLLVAWGLRGARR